MPHWGRCCCPPLAELQASFRPAIKMSSVWLVKPIIPASPPSGETHGAAPSPDTQAQLQASSMLFQVALMSWLAQPMYCQLTLHEHWVLSVLFPGQLSVPTLGPRRMG